MENYVWSCYPENITGLKLVILKDIETGVSLATPLSNPKIRTASHKAWAGARHSRAPGSTKEIMIEMGQRGIDPDKKLETTFKNYGHASVGDMARIDVHFNNVPMHLPLILFNLGIINSGQEKSTRYQKKFGNSVLHNLRNYLPNCDISSLKKDYQKLGDLSLRIFNQNKQRVSKKFMEFYKPDQQQKKALEARVLDVVRFSLLLGQDSGFAFETSARDWSRIISCLKASPFNFYKKVANQLETILSPSIDIEKKFSFKAEAPSLLRHTEADYTTNNNLKDLETYLKENTNLFDVIEPNSRFKGYQQQDIELIKGLTSQEKMVVQYILSTNPGLDYKGVMSFVSALDKKQRREIGKIIYNKHCHHQELPQLARTTDLSFIVKSNLGEVRDFNRHRAFGRFIQQLPLVNGLSLTKGRVNQILSEGYGLPLYLTEIKQFKNIRNAFEKNLKFYYDKVFSFFDKVNKTFGNSVDYSFMINLLPLAHRTNLWMHGNPKQVHYLTSLRTRPAGHINYRDLSYKMAGLMSKEDGFFNLNLEKPDASNKEEFYSRK